MSQTYSSPQLIAARCISTGFRNAIEVVSRYSIELVSTMANHSLPITSSFDSMTFAHRHPHLFASLDKFFTAFVPCISLFDGLRGTEVGGVKQRSQAEHDVELLYQFLDALATLCDVPRRGSSIGDSCTAAAMADIDGEPIILLTSNHTKDALDAGYLVSKIMRTISSQDGLDSTSLLEARAGRRKAYIALLNMCLEYRNDPASFVGQERDKTLVISCDGRSFQS